MLRRLVVALALLCSVRAEAQRLGGRYGLQDTGLPYGGGSLTGGVEITGTGTCVGADSVLADNNGYVGCQKLTDVAPQGLLLRPQPAYAAGTQSAAHHIAAVGQDETKVTIDGSGSDPAVNCAGENDTVTVTVYDSNGAATATILSEDQTIDSATDWTASTVSATCTSLAAAVDALAGVGATCTSPTVFVTLESNTSTVVLAESTAACTTYSTGTQGKVLNGSTDSGAISYAWVDATTTGLWHSGTTIGLATNGQLTFQVTTGGVLANGAPFVSNLAALTAASMTGVTIGTNVLQSPTSCYSWSNAQVAALGATTTGDISVATLPAKTRITRSLVIITGQAAGTTTLTVSVGRTSASYIDYVVASDAKVAANTVYGDADAEIGTGLYSVSGDDHRIDDLPSWTATTTVNAHFTSTGANLSAVTGSTGRVCLDFTVYP